MNKFKLGNNLLKVSMLLGLFFIVSTSCKKDEQVPIVEYFNLNNSSDTLNLSFDDTLKISFKASDNESLDGYRVSLLNNLSFTSLNKTNSLLSDVTTGQFTNPLNDSVVITSILQDSNLAGPYFATLEINDSEGNLTDLIYRNFVITRPDAPSFNLTNIDFNAPLTTISTDSLVVEGSLNDDTDLSTFTIQISSKSNLDVILTKTYSFSEIETSISLDGENEIKIGLNDIEEGSYYIFFILKDSTGNITFRQNELIIN